MNSGLTRGASASAILHILLAAVLLVGLPSTPPKEAEQTVDVELATAPGPPQKAMKSDLSGPVAAPSRSEKTVQEQPSPEPPKDQPPEPPPPPPPPPRHRRRRRRCLTRR